MNLLAEVLPFGFDREVPDFTESFSFLLEEDLGELLLRYIDSSSLLRDLRSEP
jgi:hypothetical protein